MPGHELPITVAVPVKNEERNLRGCLERLARFERVVVLDSGSTDATRAIAVDCGAELVDFVWDGRFPKKRNWFLRRGEVTTPWVLFLDADELLDDAVCDELAATLPGTPHAGFWLNYTNWFLGRRLRHGEANRKLALFRPAAGEYERIPEENWSGLDMEVHEHPVLAGSVGEIRARIEHRDYRGLDHWFRKHNDYSTWEARRAFALRRDGLARHPELTPRQRRKYASLGSFWAPWAYFVVCYGLKGGWRDGYAGFAFAWAKTFYFWQIGAKLRELERAEAA